MPSGQQIVKDLLEKVGPSIPGDQFPNFAAILADHLGDQELMPEGLCLLLVLSVEDLTNTGYPEAFVDILDNSMGDIIRAVAPGDVEYQEAAIAYFKAISA